MRSILQKTSAFVLTKTGTFLFFSALVLAIYGRSLTFDFVSYDDDFLVYNNFSVRQLSPASILEIFSGNTRVVGDTEARVYANRIYIPITFLSFQLQHALTGLNPFWFHAVNLMLFIMLVFVIHRLLFFWLKSQSMAILCATLFAIHPLNSEPVAWISGRKDLLCDLFFVLGLLFYRKYISSPNKKRLCLAILLCLLATLSKPSGGILVAVLLIYDLCYRRPLIWKSVLLEKFLFLIPIFFPVLVSMTHYALINNPPVSIERLLFCVGVPFFALSHAFLPVSLSAFYPYPTPLLWPWHHILQIMAGTLLLAGLFRLAKNEPRHRSFALAFFFLTLLPFVLRSALFPDGGFTSDRYMLLPLIGLLLLFGISFKETFTHSIKWNLFQKSLLLLLGSLLLSSLALTAHGRASIWKNSGTLALDIIEKYPSAANAQEELGRIYQQQGLTASAAIHFKKAYLADPKAKRLIQLYELYGLNQPLINLYRRELQKNPNDTRLQAGLGMVYFRLKQFALAENYLQGALNYGGSDERLSNALAGALYYQNKIPQAIEVWERALAVNPNDTNMANNLGVAYLALGKKEKAWKLFNHVVVLEPQHLSARKNLEKISETANTSI